MDSLTCALATVAPLCESSEWRAITKTFAIAVTQRSDVMEKCEVAFATTGRASLLQSSTHHDVSA